MKLVVVVDGLDQRKVGETVHQSLYCTHAAERLALQDPLVIQPLSVQFALRQARALPVPSFVESTCAQGKCCGPRVLPGMPRVLPGSICCDGPNGPRDSDRVCAS